MMQKQSDTRLSENEIRGCEQNRKKTIEVGITDTQSWNSCGEVASDDELTVG